MITNTILRIITICLFLILHIYWRLKHKGIKKIFEFKKQPFQNIFHKSVFSYAQVIVLLQLFGLTIFPIPSLSSLIKILSVLLTLSGFIICITARQSLGESWTNAEDYKEKRKFKLINSGIYKFVRHPIYSGLNMMITGAEILAQSYVLLLLPLLYLWTYKQALNEENHLISLFADKYESYKMETGMFFPRLFK